LNLPSETEGGSKIMYSQLSLPEAVPALNYLFFDKSDGEDITGGASLGDYFVVFKRNKTAIVDRSFINTTTVSNNIGCIAPYGILEYKDKVIFLSEEGWKAFDGKDIYDLSFKINSLIRDKYISYDQRNNYSAVRYPVREQLMYLIKHSSLADVTMVGHFLVPLLLVDRGIPEEKAENIVSWTTHEYSQTFHCLTEYTDSDGIIRVIAGDSLGFVYLLDSGTQDNGSNYAFEIKTGWLPLGTPMTLDKTLRMINVTYTTSATADITFNIDIDFNLAQDTITLPGADSTYTGYTWAGFAYNGVDGNLSENYEIKGSGKLYRFHITATQNQQFIISGITLQLRGEGLRPKQA